MTDKQWNALKRMTSNKYNTNFFSCTLSLGEVTLRETDMGFELEYPSNSVTLYRDTDISHYDKSYLRYLYNEYMSMFNKQ